MRDQDWLTTSAGVKMPWIIYGTAWKKERTADLVVKAIQAGFRGIDTACQPKHYNEPLVGVALHKLRDLGIGRETIFLQTKFTPLSGQDPRQVPYDKNAPIDTQLSQSFEASINNLRTEYIDSLVLHSPVAPHELLMKVWVAMEYLHRAGKVSQLGISNCYDMGVMRKLYTEASVKPAVLQNRFYQNTGYDADLRRWCSNHGVIYQSFWTLTANPHILSSNTIRTIAQKYRKTEVQVFFRYLNQTGIVPLTGTCSEKHMRQDISSLDFELSSNDLENVNRLLI